ncbi:hypothetical protein IW261DRAFT_1563775 [Armillaria novae-zelandiae]|uniref:Uncharacterized protein n=1 Tax=Armillaria novae-zelandiae TaxID=153914 RepID=A0AA39UIE3_9AGAR|nr:hypothetical protein IW261DRAFT_1563775 [Armillaria novae-zelandiae]
MSLQSRIDTGGHPHEQRKPWPTEQIALGHGHHIQPIANSLARRLGASGDGTADASLVHRISPHPSNLLSRIQGCEMHDDGDANLNGNGTERDDERTLNAERVSVSPFVRPFSFFFFPTVSLTITTIQTSQNATKTLLHSATPTAQMSPGPSHQRALHEDSVPRHSTPSSRSSQIHTDISRATLTSAISQNAKLRRGKDMGGLSDKVDAVVTNEISELFRNTLQMAQAELSEKQAAVPDESPASAFLKNLLPSVIESRSQSLDPSTEPERPKQFPAAPKAMFMSPGVRLAQSMLRAGADLTLPDEEPDTVMLATPMSPEQLAALTMMFPNITDTFLSMKLALLDIQNHPIASSLESDITIPVLLVPIAIGPVHPATKVLLAMTGAAAHTEGVELIVETTLIRLPGEMITAPGIAALHLSTSQQDMIEDAKILKALGVHAAANHYPQNQESDPTVIPNGYQKPKPNTTCVSDVPGVWVFQPSRNLPDILECSFNVSQEMAARWNLTRENNCVMAERETRDELFLHLLCLPTALAISTLDSVSTEPSQEQKAAVDALWKMQTEWPEPGSLIIEINPGKPVGKVFFPGDHPNNIHCPLEVTHTIQQGVNTIRFVQLTGMHKSFFLLASHREIPILDLAAVAELLQFRTP